MAIPRGKAAKEWFDKTVIHPMSQPIGDDEYVATPWLKLSYWRCALTGYALGGICGLVILLAVERYFGPLF